MILIVGTSKLPECDRVCTLLGERGHSFFRLDLDKIGINTTVSAVFQKNDGWNILLNNGSFEIQVSAIKAAWVAALLHELPEIDERTDESITGAEFSINENRTLVEYILDSLPVPVLSRPAVAARAANRLLQLDLAKSVGFEIAKTIISNEPLSIRQFAKDVGSSIYKPIDHCSVPIRAFSEICIPTSKFVPGEHTDGSLSRCIGTYQALIRRKTELRVIVVADRVHAIRIMPVEPVSEVDWRTLDIRMTEYQICDLDCEIETACLSLTRNLGIEFAAIDILLGEDGSYYFLEANPIASWDYLQVLSGAPIASAITDWLMERACPGKSGYLNALNEGSKYQISAEIANKNIIEP